MKRSILEQSWAVAKPRHAGAAYNRRARTVALVTSWREEVGTAESILRGWVKYRAKMHEFAKNVILELALI